MNMAILRCTTCGSVEVFCLCCLIIQGDPHPNASWTSAGLHQVSGGSSIRNHYYPALQRRWGNINGPYILQTDMCTSFAKGVADFNAFMGREAVRLLLKAEQRE